VLPAWLAASAGRGVLRVAARTRTSGRLRGPVRAYYEALRLDSSLDGDRRRRRNPPDPWGFVTPACPRKHGPESLKPPRWARRKALRDGSQGHRDTHHPCAIRRAPAPRCDSDGCTPRTLRRREREFAWLFDTWLFDNGTGRREEALRAPHSLPVIVRLDRTTQYPRALIDPQRSTSSALQYWIPRFRGG
jgi:hypothetical protein